MSTSTPIWAVRGIGKADRDAITSAAKSKGVTVRTLLTEAIRLYFASRDLFRPTAASKLPTLDAVQQQVSRLADGFEQSPPSMAAKRGRRRLSPALATRAKELKASAHDRSNASIARELGISTSWVQKVLFGRASGPVAEIETEAT